MYSSARSDTISPGAPASHGTRRAAIERGNHKTTVFEGCRHRRSWRRGYGNRGLRPGGGDAVRGVASPEAGSPGKKEVLAFRSRPELRPPAVDVSRAARGTADGYVFVAPKKGEAQAGAMILDDEGCPVWFRPMPDGLRAMDFKAQRYRDEAVITWWEGEVANGHGDGEYVILDGSYREVARVRAGNGYEGDLHEFLITDRDTALITIYGTEPWDLTDVGGPEDGEVIDGVIQEIDIETGDVLFEWHSLDHVELDESYAAPEDEDGLPFDYFHINSIDVDKDDNLLVSARKTSAVYKIDRDTGEVVWRLDGKRSDFEMDYESRSVYQHDAIPQPDGTVTILDNGISREVEGESRGIVLDLDEEEMSATLVRDYPHPAGLRAATQANMQTLPNGNVFIGWGSEPIFSEFDFDGELLFDAAFLAGAESYRAFRFPWEGIPEDAPAAAAERGPRDGEATVYASYNGATEVAEWEILVGSGSGEMESIGSTPRDGFETAIVVRTDESFVAVRARNRSGRMLGESEPIEPGE
jgi:hypothetical protein